MDRRTFLASSAVSSLIPLLASAVPLLASAGMGASNNRKGFMVSTLSNGPNQLRDDIDIVADIEAIARLGGTIVRFPLYFSCQRNMTLWLDKIEVAYQVSIRHRIVLVIDIHHPSEVPSTPACLEPVEKGGGDSTIQNDRDFVNKWREISQRVVDRRYNRDYIWYDLCNEPKDHTSQGTTWREIAGRAARAICRIDNRSKIVFAAPGTTTALASRFAPLQDIPNQVLQFHFYDWQSLQFNVTPAYPSGNYTRASLRRRLEKVRDAGSRPGMPSVPVYIGEVAINRNHPNASQFLVDFTSLCDEFGIHLTIHAYREAGVWDYEGTRTWCVLENWLRPGQARESCPRFAINNTVTETNVNAMNMWTFYPQYYLAQYLDLRQAFGNNLNLATQHWFASGILEGRMPNPHFSAIAYLNRYPDLRTAFGASNYTRAAVHWLDSGIQEGRIGI